MSAGPEIQINPEPSPEDRAAILRAVDEVLRREAALSRPSTWKLAGWTHKRAGIVDLGRWVSDARRWPLSARMPRGGREYPGLTGRADAR
jgi:hypothetical protein